MADTLALGDVQRLLADRSPPCVTIYMPTHAASPEGQQDRVRLKNLADEAERRIVEGGMRAPTAREFLARVRAFPRDPTFWNRRRAGLAVFISHETFYALRLPARFDTLTHVGERFLVKPLVALLSQDSRYYVLTLSQNLVRFYEADGAGFAEVDGARVPANMKAALDYTSVDHGAQTHTGRPARGKEGAVFHGQGGAPDALKDDLRQFFRMVDAAVRPTLDERPAPLLLAGAQPLAPLFREVTTCPRVVDAVLDGNCDYHSEHELHAGAEKVMAPVLRAARDEAARRVARALGEGKGADNLSEVLDAAHRGKVDTLLVHAAAHQWGVFLREARRAEAHVERRLGDDDLLDLATAETLRHNGTVFAVPQDDLPSPQPLAAAYRY